MTGAFLLGVAAGILGVVLVIGLGLLAESWDAVRIARRSHKRLPRL